MATQFFERLLAHTAERDKVKFADSRSAGTRNSSQKGTTEHTDDTEKDKQPKQELNHETHENHEKIRSRLHPQLGLVTLTRRASEGERFADVESGSPWLVRFEFAHAETVVRLREALDTPY